jgi:hypothetical protein
VLTTRDSAARLALIAALMLVASGHGCEESDAPLPSPVVAHAKLLEDEDGSVDVELSLRGLSPPMPVEGAHATQLRDPDDRELELEAHGPGRYVGAVEQLEPGGHYTFGFALGEERARAAHVLAGSFGLEVHVPFVRPTVTLIEPFVVDAHIEWSPSAPGLVEVRDEADELVYQNFDFDEPKWAALTAGEHVIPGAALSGSGPWVARVCALAIARPSATPMPKPQHTGSETPSRGLGWGSGAIAGRCTAITLTRD